MRKPFQLVFFSHFSPAREIFTTNTFASSFIAQASLEREKPLFKLVLKVVNPVFYCSQASLPVSERILLSNSSIASTVLVAFGQQVLRFLSLRGLRFHPRFMEVNGILSILRSLQSFDRKCMILCLMVITDERPRYGENATW